jgi:phospholipase C
MPSGYRKLDAKDSAEFAANRFAVGWMPQQEPGVRPSIALPYELAASGAVSADGNRFDLVLEAGNRIFGRASAGAPFHVYTPGKFRGQVNLRTRAYAVAAGGRLTDSWELQGFEQGNYHLLACGPNGFLREFAGSTSDPRLEVQCKCLPTGDLELHVANLTGRPMEVQVKDLSYKSGDHKMKIAPGGNQSLAMPLGASHHWYDFSVTIAGADRFLRRFAGRVETGKNGFSDPAMGRALG